MAAYYLIRARKFCLTLLLSVSTSCQFAKSVSIVPNAVVLTPTGQHSAAENRDMGFLTSGFSFKTQPVHSYNKQVNL